MNVQFNPFKTTKSVIMHYIWIFDMFLDFRINDEYFFPRGCSTCRSPDIFWVIRDPIVFKGSKLHCFESIDQKAFGYFSLRLLLINYLYCLVECFEAIILHNGSRVTQWAENVRFAIFCWKAWFLFFGRHIFIITFIIYTYNDNILNSN